LDLRAKGETFAQFEGDVINSIEFGLVHDSVRGLRGGGRVGVGVDEGCFVVYVLPHAHLVQVVVVAQL
jgi:hypothetical protein